FEVVGRMARAECMPTLRQSPSASATLSVWCYLLNRTHRRTPDRAIAFPLAFSRIDGTDGNHLRHPVPACTPSSRHRCCRLFLIISDHDSRLALLAALCRN